MLDATRLRTLLAVDAVGTTLAGLLVCALAERVCGVVRGLDAPGARFATPRVTRRVGLGVALLGATKGVAYAAVPSQRGDGAPESAPASSRDEGSR